jgi:hypothetical protein
VAFAGKQHLFTSSGSLRLETGVFRHRVAATNTSRFEKQFRNVQAYCGEPVRRCIAVDPKGGGLAPRANGLVGAV